MLWAMSEPWRRSVAALVAAMSVLLAGCTDSAPEPTADPSSPSTPLASYDTTAVALVRAPYCDAVDTAAVTEALGKEPRKSSSHDNGERVRLAGDAKDVSHEYGCTWSAGRTRAETWLFAPPVTPDRSRDLLKQARAQPGCVPEEKAPSFGTPSVALVCTDRATVTASYRGLFGDAWLVCELTGRLDRAALVDRAGRWCVQVVEAAAGG